MTTATNQNNLFSLFSEEEMQAIEVQQVKNEPAKKSQPAQSSAKPATPAKFVEPDEYPIDRVVFYAGHRLPVESRFLKLEEVREQLEEQFPELTKENADMVYDEKIGHIVPVLKGHKKGSVVQELKVHLLPPSIQTPVYHVLSVDGVYEVRETQTGFFSARVEPKMAVNRFVLKVPRIPLSILKAVVHFKRFPISSSLQISFGKLIKVIRYIIQNR